ncbi:MAG: GNAT family N-acetyltransferase [Pseudomonadota bacterium]
MNDTSIRKFESDMLDECADLYLRVFTVAPWNEKWGKLEDVKKYLNEYCNFKTFKGFVAVKNKKIVGVALGFLKPWQKGFEYYINEFYVDIDLQRSGIGTNMIETIKKSFKGQNVNAIILLTEKDYPARKFYEKCGFKILPGLVSMAAPI